MDKVRSRILTLVAFTLILAWALSGTATANLVQTQFGFPVIVHSGTSVSFSNDQASSTDNELFNMNFPAFDGLQSAGPMQGFSTIGAGQSLFAFPAISSFGNMGDLFGHSGFNLL